jgi:hypothetical protein
MKVEVITDKTKSRSYQWGYVCIVVVPPKDIVKRKILKGLSNKNYY